MCAIEQCCVLGVVFETVLGGGCSEYMLVMPYGSKIFVTKLSTEQLSLILLSLPKYYYGSEAGIERLST